MNQNSNFLGGRSCISGTNSVKRVLKGIFKPNDVLITVSKTSYAKQYTFINNSYIWISIVTYMPSLCTVDFCSAQTSNSIIPYLQTQHRFAKTLSSLFWCHSNILLYSKNIKIYIYPMDKLESIGGKYE